MVLLRWGGVRSKPGQEFTLCTGPEHLLHDVGADTFRARLGWGVGAVDLNVGIRKGHSTGLDRIRKRLTITTESSSWASLDQEIGRENREKGREDYQGREESPEG